MVGNPQLWDFTADYSGTQIHKMVATSDRFKYVKQPFTCTNFQSGNTRIYQEVDSKEGVGHLYRPHRCLFSCNNSSTISKFLRFQTKKGVFQFRALHFGVATAPLEFTHCERGKTHTSSQEPQNPSISGRLASSVTNKGTWSQRFREFREIGARTRLAYQFSKVGIGTLTKTGFSELSLQRGLVFPTQKKLDRLKVQTVSIRKSLVLTSRKLKSFIGTLASLGKTVPLGRLHMRPFQWYLKSHWKFPQSLDKRIPVTGNFLKHLKWWEDLQILRQVLLSILMLTTHWYSQMPPKRAGELT